MYNFRPPNELPDELQILARNHLSGFIRAIQRVHPKRMLFKENPEVFNQKKQALFCIGKNALQMALSAQEISHTGFFQSFILQTRGYVDESRSLTLPNDWEIYFVSHPFSDEYTVEVSKQVLKKLVELPKDTVLHVMISGGGSAAFCVPELDLDLQIYNAVIKEAMVNGLDIFQINQVRMFLDSVKGGKLAARLENLHIYTWVVSDVLNDDPSYVGSGPTIPGIRISEYVLIWLRTVFEALELSETYHLLNELVQIAYEFQSPELHKQKLICSRKIFAEYLMDELSKLKIHSEIIDLNLEGNVEEVADRMLKTLKIKASTSTTNLKTTLIWMGEPVVKISNTAFNFKGGRVSSLATLMSEKLKGTQNLFFIGLATDSKDGSSPDAGYIITGNSWKHLAPLGGVKKIYKSGNSGHVLSSLGYGIQIKDTDVNLLDLYFVVFY